MDGATLDISVQRAGQWQPPSKEFVRAIGQVSCAEPPPDPNDYPGAPPHMLHAGPLVFTPPGPSGRSEKRSASHVGFRCVMRGHDRS